MRIAWVLHGTLDQRTGGTIYDAEVVDGLRRAGDDVRVVSLHQGLGPLAAARQGAALARTLRGLACDVVVGDELCFRELAVAFPLTGRRAGRRVLLVHHLTCWEVEARSTWPTAVLEHAAITAAERLVVTSETTRTRLGREAAVVLPGADRLSDVARRAPGPAQRTLVFLGAIVPRKRVRELVAAFASAPDEARLLLVGSTTRDPAYVSAVREEAARRRVAGRVTFAGELPDAAVAAALAGADALVMPSSLEGYGIAATEALHAGLPVVAARSPGLAEALAPYPDAAVLCDDDDALAAALARLVGDAGYRASLREGAALARPRLPTWAACAHAFRRAIA
ncbi:MAG: hypothetical protein JWP97_1057 [Labilithrix sp.]|nr:hypothetical protein [Labilithrix sp.]